MQLLYVQTDMQQVVMEKGKLINVYKASAGSGKTHTLTHEYIDLILQDEEAYKHVLAVTFTNKATDEMKQRILEELYKMATNASFANSGMARRVLIKILHDYPAFAVSTIDRFFQGIMRAFARELGRMVTYGVELDAELVRTTAVDNLFADLDKKENSELLGWLIEFSLERIEKGESWRINNDISSLSKSLFSEDFKLKNGNLQFTVQEQMERIRSLKRCIGEILSGFENESVSIGKKALEIMGKHDLSCEDFKGGKNTPFNIFRYISKGERIGEPLKSSFENCHNNLDSWYTKSKAAAVWRFEEAYNDGLNDLIGNLIELYGQRLQEYATALCVQGNLNSLGILGHVYAYILDYCKEKNVMLLSETTELLGEIIDESDAPFIYEKTGTWINNFMLDEFQDTSLMQWRNFVPLLANSVADGNRNLIVGDVKQSIYRFRNSDWSILESGVDERFGEDVHYSSLDVNWRSCENIVEFNNSFFEAASTAIDLEDIYRDFKQKLPEKGNPGGYIGIDFINKKEVEEAGVPYESVMDRLILSNVERLLAKGYKQKDIGILVRWNSEGAAVAQTLLSAGYRVISADSLAISSSAAVTRVVNILKWLADPEDISMSIYSALSGNNGNLDMLSPEDGERLKNIPLYQCCEEIIRCFLSDKQKEDVAFLQSFLDMVLEYSATHGSNLYAFLKWWGENGMNKSISSPEEQDAIQVMTIHKAKGLAFEVVILPYFNCKLDHSGWRAPLIWSTAASGLLGYEGPLPVRYSQALKNTLFSDDYNREKRNVYVDNLNIAYVAFTRPRRELVILAETPVPNKDGSLPMQSVAHLLYGFVTANNSVFSVKDSGVREFDVEDVSVQSEFFTVGEESSPLASQPKNYSWLELGHQFVTPLDPARMKTSLQTGSINDELTLRDNGIIMHDLFAGINSLEDAMKIGDEELGRQIVEILESVKERGWFSDKYKVYKEKSIVTPEGAVYRPDRVLVNGDEAVVVDYKFGEYVPYNRRYHRQVARYMQLLCDMGFAKVEGYLWYVKEAAVEQVVLQQPQQDLN